MYACRRQEIELEYGGIVDQKLVVEEELKVRLLRLNVN
jgi:hypothetical protein